MDRIAALEQENALLREELAAERARTRKLEGELRVAQEEIKFLKGKIHFLVQRIFGSKSEVIAPEQLELLLAGISSQKPQPKGSPLAEALARTAPPKRAKNRRTPRFSEDLPVVEHIIDPEEVRKNPDHFRCIGQEVSTQLDVEPPRFTQHRTIRRKFVRKNGAPHAPGVPATPLIAPLPPKLLERGGFTPGCIAYFIVNKFVDHLPANRISNICQRHGVDVPRQSICRSFHLAAQWLRPVVEQMRTEMFSGNYVQLDETPVRYLKPGEGKTKKGYFWTCHVPGADTLYYWRASRSHECLLDLVPETYTGAIQCDAYGAYGTFARKRHNGLYGCWAHARRKFVEAIDAENATGRMAWMVLQINHLFAIERELKGGRAGKRLREAERASKSRMVVERIGRALKRFKASGAHLPKSPSGMAIDYCLNQWELLTGFLDNGHVEVSTNLVENAIRPTAVGKKNWLFVGAEDAGWISAVLYTIVRSCWNHGVDPYAYLRHALTRLPEMTNRQIPTITPRAYAKAQKAAAIQEIRKVA